MIGKSKWGPQGRALIGGGLLLILVAGVDAQTTVSISGQTRLPALPQAEVSIFVGAASVVPVTADDNGRFEAEIELAPGEELVRVEACGVGEQDHICYVRLVDTATSLLDKAGESEPVAVGSVSPTSTAAWAALRIILPELATPATFSEIEQFRFGLASFAVVQDAALLSLLARREAALPQDAPDFVSILLDAELKAQARNSVAVDVLLLEAEALIQNNSLMLIPEVDFDILGLSYLVPLTASRTLPLGTTRIELAPDGSGSLANRGSGAVAWTNEARGDLLFRDAMERIGIGNRYVRMVAPDGGSITPPIAAGSVRDPDGGDFIAIENLLIEVQWRQLDVSGLLSVGLLTQTTETVAPDRPDLGPEQIQVLGFRTSTSGVVSRSGITSAPPSPLPTAGSLWAFPRCEEGCTTPGVVAGFPSLDVLSFNPDGSASARISDPGISWTAVDGRIQLEQDNGFTLDVIPFGSTIVRPPAVEALETTLVVTEVRDDDGSITLLRSLVLLEADPGFNLTAESVPGVYNVREVVAGTYVLEEGGKGWFVALGPVDPDNPPDNRDNVTWEISESGDLLVFRSPSGSLVTFKIVSTPVKDGPNGFFSVLRWSFQGAPVDPEDYGGSLVFWERVSP